MKAKIKKYWDSIPEKQEPKFDTQNCQPLNYD